MNTRKITALALSLFLVIAFQNCSDVSFKKDSTSLQNSAGGDESIQSGVIDITGLTDQVVNEGAQVNFSVIVSNVPAGSNVSYSWQKDGSNLGSTSELYSIASATLADGGIYTVNVFIDGSFESSRTAILTVNQVVPIFNGSCKTILDAGDSLGDGNYMIIPDGEIDPVEVYCDMASDGGGWTLAAHTGTGDTWNHQSNLWEDANAVGTLPADITGIQDYKSFAYNGISSTEFMIQAFDASTGTGTIKLKWTVINPSSFRTLVAGTATGATVSAIEGSMALHTVPSSAPSFPTPSNAFIGQGNCHHFAGGINARVCMFNQLDFNTAAYLMFGGDYLGASGNIWLPQTHYMRDAAEQPIFDRCNGAPYICPSRQFRIFAR